MTGSSGLPDDEDSELEALAAEMERELAATSANQNDTIPAEEAKTEAVTTEKPTIPGPPDRDGDDHDALMAELERNIAARASASSNPVTRSRRARPRAEALSRSALEPDKQDPMRVHRVVVGVITALVGVAAGAAVGVIGIFAAITGKDDLIPFILLLAIGLGALFVVPGFNFGRNRGPSRVMVWIAALITLPLGAYSIWVLIRTFSEAYPGKPDSLKNGLHREEQ